MKVKVVWSVSTTMVGVASLGFFHSYQAHATQNSSKSNLDRDDHAEILNATLQIEISVPVDDSGKRIVKADGLGSLVWDGENTLLVTHNHWGEVLQEKSVVAFYDAQGKLMKSMSGSEFISLMCYLDAGSLILRSPLEGMEQRQVVIESNPLQMQAGDVVLVAQRQGLDGKEAALVEAEVESVTTIRGVPVIRLKGSEGHPVQVGDSGGGIWRDGKLVGNLWYTAIAKSTGSTHFSWLKSDEANVQETDESYAAIFPADQLVTAQGSSEHINRGEMSTVP